jgi:hypothetical protein
MNPGTGNNPTTPDYLGQFGKTPLTPGGSGAYPGLANPGLNPGYIQAGIPQYNAEQAKQNPSQNQYNWGTHPYMYQMSDLANYNSPPPPVAGPVPPQMPPARLF